MTSGYTVQSQQFKQGYGYGYLKNTRSHEVKLKNKLFYLKIKQNNVFPIENKSRLQKRLIVYAIMQFPIINKACRYCQVTTNTSIYMYMYLILRIKQISS